MTAEYLNAILGAGTEDGLLTVRQVAELLSVDPDTIRQVWIGEGISVAGRLVKLEAFRAGASWRISRRSLRAFLEACNPEQGGGGEGRPELRSNPGRGSDPAELQRRAKERLKKG